MKIFEVKDHEPSLLPEGEWELVWSDEFDGTELDTSKWDYRRSMMNRRHPAWTDQGVTLDGKSNAVFSILEEDGRPVSSQLQTGYNFMDEPVQKTTFGKEHLQWNIGKLKKSKFTQKFGYFECRCRLQQLPGWWSAFWIQSPLIGATLDPAVSGSEIDVMESFYPGEVHRHNIFTGGYGQDMKRTYADSINGDVDPAEFHRFGVLWDETGYTFYVDGVQSGPKLTGGVSHTDTFILLGTEVVGYRGYVPGIYRGADEIRAVKDDKFIVDYVRVFDRV